MTRKRESTHSVHQVEEDKVGLERLIFFSDAVFAISITLLALDIRLPAVEGPLTDAQLVAKLWALWPRVMGFTISFLVIGMLWIGHHRKFRYIQRYDGTLLMINLFLLMTIAFIPFPTSVISEYLNRSATILYALAMILTGVFSGLLWWYASHRDRLIDPNLEPRRRRREAWGPIILSGIFLLSIGLAFLDSGLARVVWVLTAFSGMVVR
jgi:uncharacterized membrane protein